MGTIKMLTTREFRERFRYWAEWLNDCDDVVMVKRPNRRNVVAISEQHYNALITGKDRTYDDNND